MAWMSEEQAAAALGVSFKTIRRRVGNGSLPSMRRGSDLLVNVELARVEQEIAPAEKQRARSLEPVAPVVAVADTAPRPVSESRLPSVVPTIAPKMHLAAATIASAAPQPVIAEMLPVSMQAPRRTNRWMEFTIWALLTLVLSGGVTATWLLQQSRERIRNGEKQYAQALNTAEQARINGVHEMTVLRTEAARREKELTSQLETERSRAMGLLTEIEAQKRNTADLRGALDLATSRLASMGSQRSELSRRTRVAEASLAALRYKASLLDWCRNLQAGWVHHVQNESMLQVPASSEPVTSADSDGPRVRHLPAASPSLEREDLGVSLRPIVQE